MKVKDKLNTTFILVLDMEYKIKKECAVDIFNTKYFAILGFTFWGMVRTPLQQS
jgi:hypothetical protein